LLGAVLPAAPIAEAGMIQGAATRPDAAAVRWRKRRRVIKLAFVALEFALGVMFILYL